MLKEKESLLPLSSSSSLGNRRPQGRRRRRSRSSKTSSSCGSVRRTRGGGGRARTSKISKHPVVIVLVIVIVAPSSSRLFKPSIDSIEVLFLRVQVVGFTLEDMQERLTAFNDLGKSSLGLRQGAVVVVAGLEFGVLLVCGCM